MAEFVLVGSYTQKLGHVQSPSCPHSAGLSIFRRAPPAQGDGFGELVKHSTLDVGPNSAFVCASPSGSNIYVVLEAYDGDQSGTNLLLSYAFDKETGDPHLLNTAETGGAAACYVETNADASLVAVANYMGGSVAVFGLNADGSVGERVSFQQHTGAAQVNAARQEKAHAHMAVFAPAPGRHLLVPDLGLDQVLSYEVTRDAAGAVALADTGEGAKLPPGSGPRHLVFHPGGKLVYILTELLSTVVTCSYDVETGALAQLGDPASTLPEGVPVGVDGKSFCSAIRISRDGAFLYVSNRGHDSIAVFGLGADGRLSPAVPIQWVSSRTGEAAESQPAAWPPAGCPRDFALAGEKDRWLIAGNQDSDEVCVFERCASSGKLSPIGIKLPCPAPACILPLL